MEEQKAFVEGAGDLGGTMRLGSQRADLVAGSVVAERLRRDERGRAPPPPLRGQRVLPRSSSRPPGCASRARTPSSASSSSSSWPGEEHPYYVATQAHPEFKSRPTRAHPLFAGLVGAAIEEQRAARLVEVERPKVAVEADAP